MSPLLTGFRKNHDTEHCLLTMLEKWRNKLEKKKFIGVRFMDFSKAFDAVNHNLLVAKLVAYGFSRISLQLMRSYLKNRKQRVNVNRSFSKWETILNGVLQGFILDSLLFHIFLNDLFLVAIHSHLSN